MDLIDQVTVAPHGGDHSKNNNVNLASDKPVGNERQYALRRLRKDRPDLHERVLAGELSPHAAGLVNRA